MQQGSTTKILFSTTCGSESLGSLRLIAIQVVHQPTKCLAKVSRNENTNLRHNKINIPSALPFPSFPPRHCKQPQQGCCS